MDAGLRYNGRLDDGTWFVRGGYSFESGLYAGTSNIVRTPDLPTFNGHAGADFRAFSISGWVRTLFNNKTFPSISDTSVLANNFAYSPYFSGLAVGLPETRTFGLDVRYRF